MKTVSLSGSLRENVGKRDAKGLRYQGKVPCVLYGGKEQVRFTTDEPNFKPILFSPETFVIEINIDGNKHLAILKDIQYHPVGDQVLHADFYEVSDTKPVVVSIPVKTSGTAPGVIRGGKLKVKLTKVKVKGLIQDIPDYMDINVSKLNIGQSVKVKDMKFEKLTMLDMPNLVIVDVKTARGVVATEESEDATA